MKVSREHSYPFSQTTGVGIRFGFMWASWAIHIRFSSILMARHSGVFYED